MNRNNADNEAPEEAGRRGINCEQACWEFSCGPTNELREWAAQMTVCP